MKDELQKQGGRGASPGLKDRRSHQMIWTANNKVEGKVSTTKGAGSSEEMVETRSKEGGKLKIEYLPLDLAPFQSTKECVRLFKERSLPLHILVNNAAVAWTPFSEFGGWYWKKVR